MQSYDVILVDGEFVIKWDDETRAEAIGRARARAEHELLYGTGTLVGPRLG